MRRFGLCCVFLLFLFMIFLGCRSTPATEDVVKEVSVEEAPVETETVPEKKAETIPEKKAETVPEEKKKVVLIEKIALVTKTVLSSGGFIDEYRTSEYGGEGISVLKEELYNSFDELLETVVYDYKDGINVRKSVLGPAGNLNSYHVYARDSSGYVERDETFNDSDELQLVSVYEYDSDGRKTKWSVLNEDNQLLSYTMYLYENGLNVRVENYSPAGDLEEYFILEYGADDVLLKYSAFTDGEKLESYIDYISEGGIIKEASFYLGNGFMREKIIYQHDDIGSVLKETIMDSRGKVSKETIREYIYREIERIVYE